MARFIFQVAQKSSVYFRLEKRNSVQTAPGCRGGK